jgi:hypothetical protein
MVYGKGGIFQLLQIKYSIEFYFLKFSHQYIYN